MFLHKYENKIDRCVTLCYFKYVPYSTQIKPIRCRVLGNRYDAE